MGTIPHVLHTSARAIQASEFADAIQAICRPRIPTPGENYPISVAVAISGGVDSMALAHLCTEVRRTHPFLKVADHRVSRFDAIVVDHQFRRGSAVETATVARYLTEHLGMRVQKPRIPWHRILGGRASDSPQSLLAALPNFETLAREQRYRALALAVMNVKAVSLFLAHHEDDMYETLLMRLMGGHGPRGLVGIPAANDLPHVHDIHGAYASGLVDDQKVGMPIYRMSVSGRSRDAIRSALRADVINAGLDPKARSTPWKELGDAAESYREWSAEHEDGPRRRPPPELEPCPVEDGGLMLYRPLLEFSKERLMATCVENGIPWIEDHTNADRTVTQRNAVRYLVKNHTLPVALQKPAVLAMSKRLRRRIALEKEEADRLFDRLMFYDFRPNVGTVTVQFPELATPRPRRLGSVHTSRWREGRLDRAMLLAGHVIQRLLRNVSPLSIVPTVEDLRPLVPRVFPALAPVSTPSSTQEPPKAFVLSDVHFVPTRAKTPDGSIYWQLSRAPHRSPARGRPFPVVAFRSKVRLPAWMHHKTWWHPLSDLERTWRKKKRDGFKPFDGGRFWVRLEHRMLNDVLVGPLALPYLKPFRAGLASDAERDLLDALLRTYAANKVRWTLPALYAVGPIEWLAELVDRDQEEPVDFYRQHQMLRRVSTDYGTLIGEEMHLIALPTLDMYLPGLEHWIRCEMRYRRVDRAVPRGIERARTPVQERTRPRITVRTTVAKRPLRRMALREPPSQSVQATACAG